MTSSQSGFLLGVGSNLEPHTNITRVIAALLKQFPLLSISRILTIPPIGMNSDNDFLNLVIFIATDIEESQLKAYCNSIEIMLGRDRTDPDRKMKDRSADLDILSAVTFPDDAERPAHTITDEYFLYPLIDELNAHLTQQPFAMAQAGVKLKLADLTFGQTATTINWNAGTSDKRVS